MRRAWPPVRALRVHNDIIFAEAKESIHSAKDLIQYGKQQTGQHCCQAKTAQRYYFCRSKKWYSFCKNSIEPRSKTGQHDWDAQGRQNGTTSEEARDGIGKQ